MFAEVLSFICTGLFAGGTLFVSLVEQPARMAGSTATALEEWRPSYKRAAPLQIILSSGGVLAAVVAYFSGRGVSTLVAAIVLVMVMPWTLSVILPVSHQLLDETRTAETPGTDMLLRKWGRLHNVRTGISLLALVILAANILGFVQ